MRNKRNRAVSRKKIQDAVIELLKDHELNDLKVTTICHKAQVNRSSFYDNYIDIYDLTYKLRQYLVDEYITMQADIKPPSFAKLLQHVKDHQDLYRLFFKLNLQKGLAEKFTANQQQQNHYHQVFFRSGIVAVIGEWLNDNCEEPVEKIVCVIEAHLNCMNAINAETEIKEHKKTI